MSQIRIIALLVVSLGLAVAPSLALESVADESVPEVGNGPQLANPVGIAVEAAGSLAVIDLGWRAVLRVDAGIGDRTLISDEAENTTGIPQSVVVEIAGTLVIGELNPFSSQSSLVRFHPETRERIIFSGPRPLPEPEQGSGPALGIPAALAREPSGALLVADRRRRAIYRVDPVTGDRAIMSGCTDVRNEVCEGPVVGGGTDLTFPEGIAVEAAGTILVAQRRQLLRVDAVSGDRTVVASATTGSGPALGIPGAIRVEASGTVLWADEDSVALFRIDPATGDRTTLSDASTGSGPPFRSVSDVAIETSGSVVVVDAVQGLAIRVNPVTGDRTILSGGPIHAGPTIECPTALVVEAAGHLVVSDRCAAAVIRVDPITGDRTVVSDASRGSAPPWRARSTWRWKLPATSCCWIEGS